MRACGLVLAAALASVRPCAGAPVGSRVESWRRDWIKNPDPAALEKQLLHSLDGALDRLVHQGQRWRRSLRRHLDGHGSAWQRDGDALRLVLQVWRHRDDPSFVLGACDALAQLAGDERAVDELERYLPQLAALILQLPADSLLTSVLERFALRVCESNAHWALQLSWIVFGAMEDQRPELGGSRAAEGAYSRAARLLQLIEQSVVYGSKMVRT